MRQQQDKVSFDNDIIKKNQYVFVSNINNNNTFVILFIIGPITKSLNELVLRINSEDAVTEGLVKFNAFILGLLK